MQNAINYLNNISTFIDNQHKNMEFASVHFEQNKHIKLKKGNKIENTELWKNLDTKVNILDYANAERPLVLSFGSYS